MQIKQTSSQFEGSCAANTGNTSIQTNMLHVEKTLWRAQNKIMEVFPQDIIVLYLSRFLLLQKQSEKNFIHLNMLKKLLSAVKVEPN